MNKFTIAESSKDQIEGLNNELPVLYKILIGNRYFLHKGKTLNESLKRFLDDVFRGIRGLKSCPKEYANVVAYCKKYPAINKVSVSVVLNDNPENVLKMEEAMYKVIADDPESLNDPEIKPYKPEWMLRDVVNERCENCLTVGIVDGKKTKFNFCPICGRVNKSNIKL